MMPLCRSLFAAVFLSAVAACACAATPTSNLAQQTDQLFAAWNKPDTPGVALAVIQDGKIVYRHGYGMADIEHDAPNMPTTPFHVASMSKQFTAFAIYLLAQDGKLSLDDDIHKYLPELQDFGSTITIRHLLHHTSGLRDQWNLLALAGWRLDDVITEDDILRLLKRQKELNFAPGKEYSYSNTGYTLLGVIVKRVSGKPLPLFAQERIFTPLGMSHTHFHDDYGMLVKGRAESYNPQAKGGYRYVALSYSNVGATSLFTTVEDLALWDQNFYDGRVGGLPLLAQMQVRGLLNSGVPIDYASGLSMGVYRGLTTVEHAGADAGFRSDLLRFPNQHFSVVVLANAGDVNTTALARRVADIYLGDHLAKEAPKAAKPSPVEIKIDPKHLDALVGDYALTPDFIIRFTKEGDRLMTQATGQDKIQVYPSSERDFFLKVVDAQFSFDAPGPDGVVAGGVLHQNGRDQVARRVRAAAPVSAGILADHEGEYYSDELHVLYTISQKFGKLILHYPRGDMTLDSGPRGSFLAGFPIGEVSFQCSAGAGCSSFTISDGRVRNLRFTKVKVVAFGQQQAGVSLTQPAIELAQPFSKMPFYVRGSMNGWGLRDQLHARGPSLYGADLMLEKGRYEFKIGSEDFSAIDFGAASAGESALTLNQARKMFGIGANLTLDVPRQANYGFMVDTSEATAPSIIVKRLD